VRIRSLANRKCFITGAAGGIGRAVARDAAKQGAELFLTDVDTEGLEAIVNEVRGAGGKIGGHRALDVSRYEEVKAWADELRAQVGAMDVLMNIAGVAVWGEIQHLEHRHWRRTIDINLMGPIHVLECFVPAMVASGRGGHIVNVASAAALFPLPWHGPYSASKFGLRGVSEVLRQDLRRHGIGVSLVCPGAVNTGMVNSVEVAGMDVTHPAAAAWRSRFVKHAVTPEKASRAITAAIKANRFMVFTSLDIRIGYWFQRKLAWPFELVMRFMNDQFQRVARKAGKHTERQ
jgi:NAD(P)-dependent dehydrogenase (short-subunit alcohol dehydrogenase family)